MTNSNQNNSCEDPKHLDFHKTRLWVLATLLRDGIETLELDNSDARENLNSQMVYDYKEVLITNSNIKSDELTDLWLKTETLQRSLRYDLCIRYNTDIMAITNRLLMEIHNKLYGIEENP